MNCRFCHTVVTRTFVDLGMQPLSNSYVSRTEQDAPETFYPLHARVCERCLLVQLPECATPAAIFSDYAYLSSMSTSWVAQARAFAMESRRRFHLSGDSRVVEVASNDGYLLKHFQEFGVSVLGVEPAANVADVARRAGVPTVTRFFGLETARRLVEEGVKGDLVVANNVLAHVPELNDFVAGLWTIVKDEGVVSIEFPHLARLLAGRQFDTIYHEHLSYFSLHSARQILEAHRLEVFDVEELGTHGGSLRVYAQRAGAGRVIEPSVSSVLEREESEGACSLARYDRFGDEVQRVKHALLTFLIDEKRQGRRIVAYGAAAKGNTLLNYAGVRGDFLDYVVDKSPFKQDKLLPGTHIPICDPKEIAVTRPDVILLLPWNLEAELSSQLAFVRDWGGRLVVSIPDVRVVS